jgi:hypothetical protein
MASPKVRMPLEVVALDDPNGRDICELRFVLVRLDGHVAWRGNAMPENATAIIDTVRGAEESTK